MAEQIIKSDSFIYTIRNQNEVYFGNVKNNLYCLNALIDSSTSLDENFSIPSYAETETTQYKVTSIMQNALCYNQQLKTVFIPKTIETIGAAAFDSCRHLREVIFEEGSALKRIYERAFCRCTQLESLIIPRSVETIGYGVLGNFTALSFVIYCGNRVFTKQNIIFPEKDITNNLKIFVVHGRYHSSFFGKMKVISASECLNEPSIKAIYESSYFTFRYFPHCLYIFLSSS